MKIYSQIYFFKSFFCSSYPFILLMMSISCANKNLEKCESIVWRDQGQRAATSGKTKIHFNELQKLCRKFKTPINKDAYIEGFELGLNLFCQPGRGYMYGKQGQVYNSSCPKKSENMFLQGYYKGRVSYLEEKQKEVKLLFRQSEDRVWRKERDYLIEATQDLVQAEQELDLLESYKEEAKSLDLQSKQIKLELIQLKKKAAALNFK